MSIGKSLIGNPLEVLAGNGVARVYVVKHAEKEVIVLDLKHRKEATAHLWYNHTLK